MIFKINKSPLSYIWCKEKNVQQMYPAQSGMTLDYSYTEGPEWRWTTKTVCKVVERLTMAQFRTMIS